MSEASAKPKISITRTEFTTAFFEMEKQLDIAGYTYHGKNVWPLVRRKVMYDFFRAQHQEDLEVNSGGGEAATSSRMAPRQEITKRNYLKRVAQVAKQHKGKVLFFFSATQKPTDFIQGKGYFRHIDPYYEWLASQYDSARIQLATGSSLPLTDLTHAVDVIGSGELVMSEMRNLGRLRRYRLKPAMGRVKQAETDVLSHLKKLDTGFFPLPNSVTGFAERVFAWEKLLMPLIESMRPRAVFMPCYFCDQQTLALVAVCRKFDIPVIDIQHGGQDNPMYYGWNGHAAESPYLANYFWMWSDYFTQFTKEQNEGSCGIPFTGGNFWIRKSLTAIQTTDETEMLRASLRKYSKVVVVSLQRGLPDHLLEVIKKAPAEWYWLLRFHPKQLAEEREYIRTLISGLTNVETERPSQINLFHLLQMADVHVTGWSTIAVEALQLGIPTVFTHNNALAGYGRLLGKSGLRLETSEAGLYEALSVIEKLDPGSVIESKAEVKFPEALAAKLNPASQ